MSRRWWVVGSGLVDARRMVGNRDRGLPCVVPVTHSSVGAFRFAHPRGSMCRILSTLKFHKGHVL